MWAKEDGRELNYQQKYERQKVRTTEYCELDELQGSYMALEIGSPKIHLKT